MSSENIMVSVYCLTYNHERYIRETIKGFLNQECSFKYEVIIHDDASTDNTAQIIREYEGEYPDIIKPIYQKENQYSRGVSIFKNHILPIAKGKYFAICEGDDYWIDPLKLQKQVDYMEKHQECTFCFTNGIIVDESGLNTERVFVPYLQEEKAFFTNNSREYALDDIWQISFVPTASFLYTRRALDFLPSSYDKVCANNDLKMRLFHTALGYSYFINDNTCVYRQNVPNSTMTNWKTDTCKQAYERSKGTVEMIHDVDNFTQGKYRSSLELVMRPHIISMLFNASGFSVFKEKYCRQVFKSFSLPMKIKAIIKAVIPYTIISIIRKIKNNLR